MSIVYEEIRERTDVPQGEDRISRKLISIDELGPCVFFLVNFIFQGKPVCYLKHYDFKEVNDSNMSQLEVFRFCLFIISQDLKYHLKIPRSNKHGRKRPYTEKYDDLHVIVLRSYISVSVYGEIRRYTEEKKVLTIAD